MFQFFNAYNKLFKASMHKKTTIPQAGRPVYQLRIFKETETSALPDNALNGEYEPFDKIIVCQFQDFKVQRYKFPPNPKISPQFSSFFSQSSS